MRCAIWHHLDNLKKREKHPWRSVNLSFPGVFLPQSLVFCKHWCGMNFSGVCGWNSETNKLEIPFLIYFLLNSIQDSREVAHLKHSFSQAEKNKVSKQIELGLCISQILMKIKFCESSIT